MVIWNHSYVSLPEGNPILLLQFNKQKLQQHSDMGCYDLINQHHFSKVTMEVHLPQVAPPPDVKGKPIGGTKKPRKLLFGFQQRKQIHHQFPSLIPNID